MRIYDIRQKFGNKVDATKLLKDAIVLQVQEPELTRDEIISRIKI